MRRLSTKLCAVLAFSCASVLISPCPPFAIAAPEDVNAIGLDLERVTLLDGRTYDGLIESEDTAWVNLIQIRRPNGKMHLVIRPIERRFIASLARLDPAKREALRAEIDRWRNRAAIEAARMDAVSLQSDERADWKGYQYQGKWFLLESSLDEEMTRRVIVRVEQVFTAYRQMLAPRCEPAKPLRLMICGSMAEYRGQLARLGIEIKNPACFVPAENLVVAGSELNRCTAELAKIKAEHEKLKGDLVRIEKEAASRLAAISAEMQQNGVPADQIAKTLASRRLAFEKEITKKKTELRQADQGNQRKFELMAGTMFSQIYHEAFHAWLENFVYPHDRFDVPLWLNEGLAQVFESCLVDSETLHVDLSSRELSKRLKNSPRGLISLPNLLAATPADFLSSKRAADYYLTAWSLAHYLAFERQIFDPLSIDRYVQQAEKPTRAEARFEKLIGGTIGAFEPQWRAWIPEVRNEH